MAQFAAPTTDENLTAGWNVQGNFTGASTLGYPGPGYGITGVIPPASSLPPGQANAGFPNPPGAMNIGAENSAAYSTTILSNPGYMDAGLPLGPITAPAVPATTVAAFNPSGLACQVNITGGTVTAVSVAPWNAAGPGSATFVQVATASGVTVTVPAAGYIKMTYSSAPTWTWIATP